MSKFIRMLIALGILAGVTVLLNVVDRGKVDANMNNINKEKMETKPGKIKVYNAETGQYEEVERVVKSEEKWKKLLSPEVFKITRQQGTERAFTGKYWNNKKEGLYVCPLCGNHLFDSKTKFESGTGWPSFWKPVAEENIETRDDRSFFMHRTEVVCRRCGAHLGHVFDDGPAPTYKRYCINSAALKFVEGKK